MAASGQEDGVNIAAGTPRFQWRELVYNVGEGAGQECRLVCKGRGARWRHGYWVGEGFSMLSPARRLNGPTAMPRPLTASPH